MHRGFTRLDWVLGMLLILPVGWYAIPQSMMRREAAFQRAAQDQVCELARAVDRYADDNGAPPTEEQGLAALIRPPAVGPVPRHWRRYLDMDQIPWDPWGDPYLYQTPGARDDLFIISSLGPDRPMRGIDDDEVTSLGCGQG